MELLNTTALETTDVQMEGDNPTLRVRRGKGGRNRLVPLHPELRGALQNGIVLDHDEGRPLLEASRSTAWRWVKLALNKAEVRGLIPYGRRVATHTLHHSAARHWLANRVPINVVSRWLGHAHLQTTLIYLNILPDPMGYMQQVP